MKKIEGKAIYKEPYLHQIGWVHMNNVEYKRYRDFLEKHKSECKIIHTGCIIIVAQCSIGSSITLKCERCNTESDITDYDVW